MLAAASLLGRERVRARVEVVADDLLGAAEALERPQPQHVDPARAPRPRGAP